MKKSIYIIILTLSTFFLTFKSCGLLSAAGLSNKGLPIKEVNGKLTSTTVNSSVNLNHDAWTVLLKKYVDNQGNVDYKGFKKDHVKLTEYLNYLSKNKPTTNWSVQELLAYYINVYNAFTVALIVENYPVSSIKDIRGPWKKKFIPIGDETLSLGDVEHKILRKMKEPRIHFAINCASHSCPKLLNEAYEASKIDQQLDVAAKKFINSSENKLSEKQLYLSKIFDWFGKDFISDATPTIASFINAYTKIPIQANAKVSYFDYDWSLNEKK
ncbi:MAG: DUF547 domain-containing protein [Flavobacteriaceae bacterium CG_4_8_14_3_um_filter_34_10]|nr:DUF547 domain-containing protein [Flavobacteriia bacterium]OIP51124.1 MAG: hypothetical protein AUK33_05440 [Flavobacteriaceae bacterium CG2_30_34_30]PIV51651.1 MAG: DUF547 domain-containing protein [Flavobacteriaceae bacterium CG02_land_8_20_14_3_00_34_13]PIX09049.1 MAG: DUF547 domain-containing protein [Flavobacteriaceae bacterium CG_4_8_14_3_um_filter_34_10]PIZ06912.1 MAG: DUF547 domain-containing protein [Flavobacteriaceae bacterium CG_4_10_14_0_8_um_filter_34_31]PJC07246.1 MAG: DUF547 